MWVDTLRSTAEIAIALSAIIGFILLLARLRPVKWLTRRLLTDPFKYWFRSSVREEVTDVVTQVVEQAIAPIKAELSFNGGSSLKDQVTQLVRESQKTSENAA